MLLFSGAKPAFYDILINVEKNDETPEHRSKGQLVCRVHCDVLRQKENINSHYLEKIDILMAEIIKLLQDKWVFPKR